MKMSKAENAAWVCGVCVALASAYQHNHDKYTVVEVLRECGVTLKEARRCDVPAFDISELKKAGAK